MASAAVVITSVVCLTGTTGASAQGATLHQEETSQPLGPSIKRVVVNDEIGDVIVKTGRKTRVTTIARYDRKRPVVQVTTRNGSVRVKASCPSSGLVDGVVVGANDCSVDVVVVVAAVDTVTVSTQVGSISVRDAEGPQDLRSSVGEINVVRAMGFPVTAHSDTGSIKVTAPGGAYHYTARTDSGDVAISGITYREASKRTIQAVTSTGDVSLKGY